VRWTFTGRSTGRSMSVLSIGSNACSVVMPALKNCRGGFNVQATSSMLDCSFFDSKHGQSSVIKGTYKCSGNVTNPGNIGTAGTAGGGTKKSGAVGTTTASSAILVCVAGALAVA